MPALARTMLAIALLTAICLAHSAIAAEPLITSFRGDWCRAGKYSNKIHTYEPCAGKQKPDIRFWANGTGYSTKTRHCKILSTKLTGGPENEQIVHVRCTDRQGVAKNITAGFGHICDGGCIGFYDLKDKADAF
jgi:hypothetical protein